jgi:type II secretory pathway component GspD/PulD (secretin)
LEPIKNSIAKTSKEAKIYYKDDKVVLDGVFESDKDKQTLLSLLAANDINTTKDVVDISKIKKPPVMVRARLYVVELTNRVGHEYQNGLLVSAVSSKQRTLNTNPNPNPPPAIANVFDQSVTLSGGLTTIAGILGPYFNLEATLSFLKTNSLAKILDETTISVLENKEGKFHAGGTIYVTTQSISSSGVANTSLIPINYGILLGLKANTIMDGGFVNMTIHTESSKLDQTNKVNGIPATTTKQIDTNVIAKNNSVIVLGGMINSEDSNAIKKIPLLGDIPVLGALFRSESFVQGQSELAFFIVPEIIDASEKTDIGFMKDSVKEKEEFEKKAIENKISKN